MVAAPKDGVKGSAVIGKNLLKFGIVPEALYVGADTLVRMGYGDTAIKGLKLRIKNKLANSTKGLAPNELFNPTTSQEGESIADGYRIPAESQHALSISSGFKGKIFEKITEAIRNDDVRKKKNYFLSFSGIICKDGRGDGLRSVLAGVGRDELKHKIMVETDAPYLGFPGCRSACASKKKRQYPNVPSALPRVVDELAKCLGVPEDEKRVFARELTNTARSFFSCV